MSLRATQPLGKQAQARAGCDIQGRERPQAPPAASPLPALGSLHLRGASAFSTWLPTAPKRVCLSRRSSKSRTLRAATRWSGPSRPRAASEASWGQGIAHGKAGAWQGNLGRSAACRRHLGIACFRHVGATRLMFVTWKSCPVQG